MEFSELFFSLSFSRLPVRFYSNFCYCLSVFIRHRLRFDPWRYVTLMLYREFTLHWHFWDKATTERRKKKRNCVKAPKGALRIRSIVKPLRASAANGIWLSLYVMTQYFFVIISRGFSAQSATFSLCPSSAIPDSRFLLRFSDCVLLVNSSRIVLYCG